MQVTGKIRVHAPQSDVFAFAQNVALLTQCIEGCRDLQERGDGTYAARIEAQIAFLRMTFNVTVALARVEPPHVLEARITGSPANLAGKVDARATLTLEPVDAGETDVTYALDLSLAGKLGGMGESVFRAKAKEYGDRFAACLRDAVESRQAEKTL
ncbi:hypothetical protein EPN52_05985 [bacterium]|nr:MAG: hypothetical protein EPN52_05985 [bacterium]